DRIPDATGLQVDGVVDVLDAAGWIAFAANDGQHADAGVEAPPGSAPPAGAGAGNLRSVDLQVGRLELLGSAFPDAALRMRRPAGGGTRVEVKAAAIAGGVDIPQRLEAGVHARFARLHWPEAPEPDPEARAAADAGESDDPGKVPPLDIVV